MCKVAEIRILFSIEMLTQVLLTPFHLEEYPFAGVWRQALSLG